MIIEGEYFYKGAMRLSWSFGSPNQLGALFASVVPLLWGVASGGQGERTVGQLDEAKHRYLSPHVCAKAVFRTIEFGLWLAIGATASRGAALAALGAAAAWSVSSLRLNYSKWRTIGIWFGLRFVMCLLGFISFSFGGRIAPGFLAHDDSIGNRLILWKGASTLIAASPWAGWGRGESGNAFMQWVQPLDRLEAYKTMVNSFLHVGVEGGLPILVLVLSLTFAGISWGLVFEKNIKSERLRLLARASSCVLLSWALSNVFSTLFRDLRLWVFPILAILLLFGTLASTRYAKAIILHWIGVAFGAALLGCAGVFLAGVRGNSQRAIHLVHPSKGVTILSRSLSKEKARWGLLVDKDVLGKRYGHELRRWGDEAGALNIPWSVAFFDARFWDVDVEEAKQIDHWIFMGETAGEADSLLPGQTVIFMHPRGALPLRWRGRGTVVLNGVDEEGSHENWTQWASRNNLRIVHVSNVGLDARAEWPLAYMHEFEVSR